MNTNCAWVIKHPLDQVYHDQEWGVATFDDRKLFEFLTLEGAQAGLSWITILKKRAGYRAAFEDYDIDKLAKTENKHTEFIIENFDIVKNRRKIESVFSNARASQELIAEYGSLSEALWQFVDHKPVINAWTLKEQVPAFTEQSVAMSQFLKKRGFKFVGKTICYAFMQAVGMVDDHLTSCPCKSGTRR